MIFFYFLKSELWGQVRVYYPLYLGGNSASYMKRIASTENRPTWKGGCRTSMLSTSFYVLKEYVLFLVCFDLFIGGPETVYGWDREKEIPAGLCDVMGFLYQRLPALRDLGAEMWPMEQATVYFRWARGLAHPYGDLIVVTYDASEKGIAAAISMEPGKILRLEGMHFEGVSTIVTF